MKKPEKLLLALAAVLVVAALVFFAAPMPQAVFTQSELAPAGTAAPDERLDINRATAEELDELPGIGEALAGRIVAYREANGAFSAPEELLEVDGIGEARYAAMEDYICCEGETP